VPRGELHDIASGLPSVRAGDAVSSIGGREGVTGATIPGKSYQPSLEFLVRTREGGDLVCK